MGTSALCVQKGWTAELKEEAHDLLSAKGKNKFRIDEITQYMPITTVYALNLCGVKGRHRFVERAILLAMSYATMGLFVNTMKPAFREKRPDNSTRNSFPSGHTATAFMGAEYLWKEYKDSAPWEGLAGYGLAAVTGYLRIYNNRHYINDVIAGACIGMMSTKVAYWLYPKIFRRSRCGKSSATVIGLPWGSADGYGLSMNIVF